MPQQEGKKERKKVRSKTAGESILKSHTDLEIVFHWGTSVYGTKARIHITFQKSESGSEAPLSRRRPAERRVAKGVGSLESTPTNCSGY